MDNKSNQKAQMATMIKFTPGDCEAAIELYKRAFGATVEVFMRFADAGEQEVVKTEEDKQLIYHARLDFEGQRYLLCDNLFDDLPRGHSLYLVATYLAKDGVIKSYEYMKEGATIISPLHVTDFADYSEAGYALIDRFGIQWEVFVYNYDA